MDDHSCLIIMIMRWLFLFIDEFSICSENIVFCADLSNHGLGPTFDYIILLYLFMIICYTHIVAALTLSRCRGVYSNCPEVMVKRLVFSLRRKESKDGELVVSFNFIYLKLVHNQTIYM